MIVSSPFLHARRASALPLWTHIFPTLRHRHHGIRVQAAESEFVIEVKSSSIGSPAVVDRAGQFRGANNDVLCVAPRQVRTTESKTTFSQNSFRWLTRQALELIKESYSRTTQNSFRFLGRKVSSTADLGKNRNRTADAEFQRISSGNKLTSLRFESLENF